MRNAYISGTFVLHSCSINASVTGSECAFVVTRLIYPFWLALSILTIFVHFPRQTEKNGQNGWSKLDLVAFVANMTVQTNHVYTNMCIFRGVIKELKVS